MQKTVNHLKGKHKYAMLLLGSAILLLFLCREIKAKAETDYMFCGSVATAWRQEGSRRYAVLRGEVQKAYVQWRESMGIDFYFRFSEGPDERKKTYMQWRKRIRTHFFCRFLEGTWEVKEYVDSAVESTGAEWEDEAEYEAYVKRSADFLGVQFVLNKEDITERAPGGFVFDSYEDLFASVRQPPTLGITPPFVGAMISTDEWEQGIHAEYIFIDSKGKAYLKVRGYFFVIERIEE